MTITHFDVYRLIQNYNSLDNIQPNIAFYVPEQITKLIKKQMYVPAIETSKGLAYLGLRKNSEGECCFYSKKFNRCTIYPYRPLACRTFPFAFNYDSKANKMTITFTRASKDTCKGLEKGENINRTRLRKLGIYQAKILQDFKFVCREINRSAKKEGSLTVYEILWILKAYAEKSSDKSKINNEEVKRGE